MWHEHKCHEKNDGTFRTIFDAISISFDNRAMCSAIAEISNLDFVYPFTKDDKKRFRISTLKSEKARKLRLSDIMARVRQHLLSCEFSEDGVGLSGGEAQKIVITRVLARPFELIIMDDPSSTLAPIVEYELNQLVLKNADGRTVIFI